MQKLVLFRSGNSDFAVDRNCIKQIIPVTAVTVKKQRRTIKYKGRAVLLVDLGAAFRPDGVAPAPSDASVILVDGSPELALWADHIISMEEEADPDQMVDLPAVFASTSCACFPKVLRLSNQLSLVVNTAALVELEDYSGTVAGADNKPGEEKFADSREAAPVKTSESMNYYPQTPSSHNIELIVHLKLKQIIRQRVKQVVSQTIAPIIKRHPDCK